MSLSMERSEMKQSQGLCGKITQKAHGHHLIPYSEGGEAHLQNMITFCPECHRKYHSGELNIDIDRF